MYVSASQHQKHWSCFEEFGITEQLRTFPRLFRCPCYVHDPFNVMTFYTTWCCVTIFSFCVCYAAFSKDCKIWSCLRKSSVNNNWEQFQVSFLCPCFKRDPLNVGSFTHPIVCCSNLQFGSMHFPFPWDYKTLETFNGQKVRKVPRNFLCPCYEVISALFQ